jgi:hypothetical protein
MAACLRLILPPMGFWSGSAASELSIRVSTLSNEEVVRMLRAFVFHVRRSLVAISTGRSRTRGFYVVRRTSTQGLKTSTRAATYSFVSRETTVRP